MLRLTLFIGSFRTSDIYVLRFTYVAGGTCTLKIISAYSGNGPHTYLTYNQKQTNLYTTSSTGHLTSWRKGTSTSDDGKETPVLSFQNTVKRGKCYRSVQDVSVYEGCISRPQTQLLRTFRSEAVGSILWERIPSISTPYETTVRSNLLRLKKS